MEYPVIPISRLEIKILKIVAVSILFLLKNSLYNINYIYNI